MKRRDALKLLAATAALPLLSRDAFSLFRAIHQELPSIPALKTLNPHQNATVTTISELIIPQTDTPGAKAARVNEFIDLILTDWYDDDQRSAFLAGLADVDARSQSLFGKGFVSVSPDQQTQILTTLDQQMAPEKRFFFDLENLPKENFFASIKQLTLVGYYTSEIGFEQELHQQIIPPRHAGCAPLEPEAAK
ncbi:MAG: gluconate 2-dehydrogenase subunit 3 family protein [Terriglobales bacterium]